GVLNVPLAADVSTAINVSRLLISTRLAFMFYALLATEFIIRHRLNRTAASHWRARPFHTENTQFSSAVANIGSESIARKGEQYPCPAHTHGHLVLDGFNHGFPEERVHA